MDSGCVEKLKLIGGGTGKTTGIILMGSKSFHKFKHGVYVTSHRKTKFLTMKLTINIHK